MYNLNSMSLPSAVSPRTVVSSPPGLISPSPPPPAAWQAPFLYIFHFNAVEVVEVARGSFRAADAVPPAVSQLQLNGARFLAATEAGVVVAAAPQPGAAQLHRLTVASEAVEDTTSVSSWADTDR